MTTSAPDDLSLRAMLDSTLKDFGVQAAPAATERAPQANITKPPIDRRTQALLASSALLVVAVIGYFWGARQPTAAPTPRATAVATFQPTAAPTVLPTAGPAALVGYFDYSNPSSATALTAGQIRRVVGTAGERWRLVDVGNARVWIAADQVPAGVPADAPLPDLAPRRPAPVVLPAVQPVAPPVAPLAPCTRENAAYIITRQVQAGTLPIGEVTGFSCTSAAEAEANASAHEQQVHASYQATTTTKTSEATR